MSQSDNDGGNASSAQRGKGAREDGRRPREEQLAESAMRAADRRAPAGPCPDAEVLALYAERELPADELVALERHVAGCGRCQASVAAFVRSAAPAGAAAGAAGVVAPWWAGWRWMVPVAATAAVVTVAVWVGRTPADQVAESPELAASAGGPESARVAESARMAESAPLEAEAGAVIAPPPAGTLQAPPAKAASAPTILAEELLAQRPAPTRAPSAAAAADQVRAAEAGSDAAASDLRRARESVAPFASAAPAPVASAAPAAPAVPASSALADAPASAREKTAQPVTAARAEASGAAGATSAPAAAPAPLAAAASGERNARQAIAKAATDGRAVLAGTVTYRTRDALPAGAVIEVRLLDVSRADAPAETLARTEIVTTGEQEPVPFTLRYAPDAIQPRRRYIVQVTIAIDGRVMWRTSTSHPVFADGAATTSVAVIVEPIR